MIDETALRYLEHRANPIRPHDEWQLEDLYADLVRVFSTPPEDEGKQSKRKRRGGSGIAIALAERDLQIMVEQGEDMPQYLREKAFPHGTLRRNVDQETAKAMLQEEVRKAVDEVLALFCPQDRPVSDWRLGDAVRALEERYEGVADDLGREGLLAIPSPDLHQEVRGMAREVYINRERGRIDLEIEKAVRHYLASDEPADLDLLGLLEYLDYHLHDVVVRLGLEALEQTPTEALLDVMVERIMTITNVMIERQEKDKKNKDAAPMPLLNEESVRPLVEDAIAKCLGESKLGHAAFLQGLALTYGTAPVALATQWLRGVIVAREQGTPAAQAVGEALRELIRQEPAEGQNAIGLREFRHLERYWLLSSVDKAWIHHLLNMDELRDGIHLRGHAQRDPLVEYQREASDLFDELMMVIAQRTTQKAFSGTEAAEMDAFMVRGMQAQAADLPDAGPVRTVNNGEPKVRRNDPCPCGSGKKYKVCCMKD
jgi:hypothetical protein